MERYMMPADIQTAMTNVSKKTPGTRSMNAFPSIVLLITLALAVVVYLEIL